jgi:phosphoribosylamine-glycine ligase
VRIALSSYSGYGAWYALRLLSEGHKIDYYLSEPECFDICGGLVPKPKLLDIDRRKNRPNEGFPDYSKYDLSIFDLTGRKQQADFSANLCPTIGDGSFQCFLEDDRLGGIKIMEEAGIKVPPYETFTETSLAKAHIKKTGKRFVYKPNGGQDQDSGTTYVAKDAEDLLKYIDKLFTLSKAAPFILQEFVKGVECSVEGWFNGTDFYLLNCTLEEKKFMNKNKGPNTGCAGNLLFTINSNAQIYQHGLSNMKKIFSGIGFVGMVDLNTIITEDACYGLEWTPRFGYDSSATFMCMYNGDLGQMMYDVATRNIPDTNWKAEFGVSARLSVPPYPTEIKYYGKKLQGIPIKGIAPENRDEILKTYLYDACLSDKNGLEVAGHTGFIACPIEVGNDPTKTWDALEKRLERIEIPDMQYRTDLKDSTLKRYYELKQRDWL